MSSPLKQNNSVTSTTSSSDGKKSSSRRFLSQNSKLIEEKSSSSKVSKKNNDLSLSEKNGGSNWGFFGSGSSKRGLVKGSRQRLANNDVDTENLPIVEGVPVKSEKKKFADNYPVWLHPVEVGNTFTITSEHWEGDWFFKQAPKDGLKIRQKFFVSEEKKFDSCTPEAGGLPNEFLMEEDEHDINTVRMTFTIPETGKEITYKVTFTVFTTLDKDGNPTNPSTNSSNPSKKNSSNNNTSDDVTTSSTPVGGKTPVQVYEKKSKKEKSNKKSSSDKKEKKSSSEKKSKKTSK